MASAKLLGLDIGSTAIRAVETSHSRSGTVVTGCAQVPLPAGAVQGGIVHDAATVTAALKKLRADSRFRGRKVVLAVTHPQLFIREMSLPSLPKHEIRKALPFQVHDMLPLPVEQSVLDFVPLDPPGADQTVRGLLIAVPKESVIETVGAVDRAGLQVTRVDLAQLALLRAVSLLDSQVEAIIDIGAQSSSVVVHNDGRPLIVRRIPWGSAEITQVLVDRLGCSYQEAESLKSRIGLREDIDPRVAGMIRDAVGPFLNELGSSFAYLISGDRHTQVTRLVMSGGGAMLPGLLDALRTQLSVTVLPANPLIRLAEARRGRQQELDRFLPSAAISIGLTLGAS